jgi:phosphate-selective porin OprO/OprP
MMTSYTHRGSNRASRTPLVAGLALWLASGAALAQSAPLDAPPPAGALPETGATRSTEATVAAGPPGVVPTAPSSATARVGLGRGLTVASADGRVSLTLRGFLQPRLSVDGPVAMMPAGTAAVAAFSLRRARVLIVGTLLGPTLSYVLHFGVAPQDISEAAPLFEASVAWAPHRDLSVRAGQFFVPFNRNRWISIMRQLFLERPLATNELNLDRDVGVMLFSNDLFGLGGRLNYALGVFDGSGRNRIDADYGFLYSARIGVNPLGRFEDHDSEWDLAGGAPRLALGIAGAFNHRSQRLLSTTGASFMNGQRVDYLHAAFDALFKWRGFSLQTEAIARLVTDPVAAAQPMFQGKPGFGYTVQAGYVTPVHLGVGARWSHTFAMGPDNAFTGASTYETGAIVAYHALDGAVTVGLDYNVRDALASSPSPGGATTTPTHSARLQVQLVF